MNDGDFQMNAVARAADATARRDTNRDTRRDTWLAMRRGFMCRCPNCGEGKLYQSYLKVVDNCAVCGEELHHHRADDAPPYFTIFIIGHFVVALLLAFDERWPDAPLWVHALLWTSFIVLASLWLLPLIKGALVGYQWALRMHGFGADG